MNKVKFINKTAIMFTIAPMLLTSCATIVSGGSPKITIDGNVSEPVTITTTKQTYSNVTLPYVVKVKRHKLNGQRISIQSETTRYKDVVLEKKTNGWAWGNILFGGLIGWGIDLGTNSVSKPSQKKFYINASDVQTQAARNGIVASKPLTAYEQMQATIDERINIWMKRLPGESDADYLARTSEESIQTQRLEYIKTLSTEMAGNRVNTNVSKLEYNPNEELLGVSFTDMPSIALSVPKSEVGSINETNGFQFANTVYNLNPDNTFEVIYTEALNPATGKKYIYTKQTNAKFVQTDGYMPLRTVQQDMLNNQRLQAVATATIQEAKDKNILTDNTTITVSTELIPTTSGKTDYRISYNYTVAEAYSTKEDFAPGKYEAEKSAASTAMLNIIRQSMTEDFAKYIKAGKAVDISYQGSADASPIRGRISYNGRYGDIKEQVVNINDVPKHLTVTKASGITSNEQLSLVRAVSVRDYILKNVPALKEMSLKDSFSVKVASGEGAKFRRVAVDIVFHDISF